MSKDSLKVHGLSKRFGKKEVVKGISFEMVSGEVVGLLGPNGAGKTTAFYMIAGFIKPNGGQILLNGKPLRGKKMYQRARMGITYLPQEPSVFRKLTVEKNIWAILETRKDITLADKKQLLEELLDELGINEIRKQMAYTLSGGERRRTEIARALAITPRFLLLDEPFAGIDPLAVYEIKKLVEHLSNRDIGVLITDHNARDILDITGRSYIISHGEIMASGSREELVKNHMVKEVYLGHEFEL